MRIEGACPLVQFQFPTSQSTPVYEHFCTFVTPLHHGYCWSLVNGILALCLHISNAQLSSFVTWQASLMEQPMRQDARLSRDCSSVISFSGDRDLDCAFSKFWCNFSSDWIFSNPGGASNPMWRSLSCASHQRVSYTQTTAGHEPGMQIKTKLIDRNGTADFCNMTENWEKHAMKQDNPHRTP